MDWEKLDWEALDRLREGFLSGAAAQGPYWRSLGDLANYDVTYGERIGWKWDAVLQELRVRGWAPRNAGSSLAILDWGCGSGIAGRRLVRALGPKAVGRLQVWDHSPLARQYAAEAAAKEFPGLSVELLPAAPCEADVLVLSHVVNELDSSSLDELRAILRRSQTVLWVEPGTHAVSRSLVAFREELRAEFRVVAPCTHQAACGLLAPENSSHWCHAFAAPPTGIYADSDWVKFGQRAGIDLRSLPYSFLVLERAAQAAANPLTEPESRIIGDPRHYKGFAKLLDCSAAGLTELTLQKRADPVLFKALKRETGVPIYRWTRATDQITKGEKVYPEPSVDAGETA